MGEVIPISDAPSRRETRIERQERAALETIEAEYDVEVRPHDAPLPTQEFIEQRVRLSREEFRKVATGTYPKGQTPENGPPVTRIVDKRGAANPTAAEHAAERQAREDQRQAQAAWARQAAGTMWWMAQGIGQSGNTAAAERALAKREQLLDGARRNGVPV